MIVNIALFISGIAVGIGIVFLRSKLQSDALKPEELLKHSQQENVQLKQGWQDNVDDFKDIASALEVLSEKVQTNIKEAEQQLTEPKPDSQIPFFSTEATEILQVADSDSRKVTTSESQPLDYSNGSSGVFKGTPPTAS